MLSEQAIEEFRVIYRNQYGNELSLAEATKQANNLIRLYKAVLSPLKNDTSQSAEINVRDSA
ncbi:MAG: hypothetical protein GY775_19950 [Candidatus Scalindua sp.]|nr:hypothetical protein [Candidatus Scalindua sp.]